MSTHLPPLTALRAFEAAARHLSFAKAAEELNVTPAALSFQIKTLEQHLGAQVFVRLNRAVRLTEVGQALAPGLSDGFQALNRAWRNAQRLTHDSSLQVTAGPAFTAKWLAPRFYQFARAHPEIDLRFSATLRSMDFAQDEIDVALRFGHQDDDPALFSLPLGPEWVTPMMTPELAEKYPTPDSLANAPLIQDESRAFLQPRADWPAWFRLCGLPVGDLHGPSFTGADHALDAALAGAGVTLGWRSLAAKDLQDGRLVAPFREAIQLQFGFRFLCQKGAENRPNILAFRRWLVDEMSKLDKVTDRFTLVPVESIPHA